MTQQSQNDSRLNEFCRIINVHHVGVGSPATYTHTASFDEIKALSDRLEVGEVHSVEFSCTVTARGSYAIDHDVTGTYRAVVSDIDEEGETQTHTLSGEFDIRIASFEQEEMYDHEDYDDLDVEFTEDGEVDIGEIVAQYIIIEYCSLNYDFSEEDDENQTSDTDNEKISPTHNPFSNLSSLLDKK